MSHRKALEPILRLLTAAVALLGAAAAPVLAQDARDEQFYYPGSFNYQFLKSYNNAGRLFNAFDYGHAVLYEKLYTKPDRLVEELERKQFTYLTTDLLVRPPRFAVAEEAVASSYAKLAWRAKIMFDWTHLLHRQIYDVYADERLSMAGKDALIEKLTDYYLSNESKAFPPVPKSMTLMDDQYYSQVFRKGYPKMNGLIWAYHWLQVGLYEPLIVGETPAEKKAGVDAALARFWSMVEDPPQAFPKVMPMTATVAPNFTRAHPRAAAIFDNLHMMHDIISDILAADTVPEGRKRQVIYAALDEFQDTTRNVMTLDEWLNMGHMMGGIAAMGGPASGLIPEAPSRNVRADAMKTMREHGMRQGDAAQGMNDGAMRPSAADTLGREKRDPMQAMMDLHMRMMADSVIRQRMMADSAMRSMMRDMMESMPAEHRGHMRQMMGEAPAPAAKPAPHADHTAPPGRPAPAGKQPVTKKAAAGAGAAPADSMAPMAHDSMDHDAMKRMQHEQP